MRSIESVCTAISAQCVALVKLVAQMWLMSGAGSVTVAVVTADVVALALADDGLQTVAPIWHLHGSDIERVPHAQQQLASKSILRLLLFVTGPDYVHI